MFFQHYFHKSAAEQLYLWVFTGYLIVQPSSIARVRYRLNLTIPI